MDIARKLQRAKEAINIISRADDTPESANFAVLEEIKAHIEAEKLASTERRAVSESVAGQ